MMPSTRIQPGRATRQDSTPQASVFETTPTLRTGLSGHVSCIRACPSDFLNNIVDTLRLIV